jgi:hypothetical protein
MKLHKRDPGQRHWEEFIKTLPEPPDFDFQTTLQAALEWGCQHNSDDVTMNRLMTDAIASLLIDVQRYHRSVNVWVTDIQRLSILAIERYNPSNWSGPARSEPT